MEITLKLPNDVRIIQPCTDLVYRWATECGLREEEAAELSTAFVELITDVVLFAFDGEGEFTVSLKIC